MCEVEDCVAEWYLQSWFRQHQTLPDFSLVELERYFKVVSFECAGSDGVVYKIRLEALKQGKWCAHFINIFVDYVLLGTCFDK